MTVRTVLVTGANRGLGLEFCRQFAVQGDRVIAASRRSSPELEALDVERVTLDVGDEASIAACRAQVGRITDRLDVVVNNAGIPNSGRYEDSEAFGALRMDAMLDVLRINAVGPLLFTQACLDLLREGEGPRVAAVSSLFSQIGPRPDYFADNFAYSASKASINLFMRSLGILLAKDGILAVAVDPGWVRTDMGGPNADLSPEDSVRGMVDVIDRLTSADSGAYLSWTGERLAY